VKLLIETPRSLLIAVVAAGIALGSTAQIASAGVPPAFQPDGRIKKGAGSLVGNDIYNNTGTNQSVAAMKARGTSVTFTISIQNDGTTADQFAVGSGLSIAVQGYSIRYYHDTTEITTAINTRTYATGTVQPGDKWVIAARVKVLMGAAIGSEVNRLIHIGSVGNSVVRDSVKFTVARK